MKLKLNTLAGEEQEFQWNLSHGWVEQLLKADVVEDPVESELYSAHGDLDFHVWVHRNEKDVFFRATLNGELQCMCVRCLENFVLPLSLQFQGVFVVPDHASSEEPDEAFTYYFDGDEIDFTQPLRENIFLELPLNPTCLLVRDSCIGEPLVEKTIADTPAEAPVDPRWAALQQIKATLPSKKG